MGYNIYVSKLSHIASQSAVAATPVLAPIIPNLDMRVSIARLRLKAGVAGGTLCVLQTEGVYKSSLTLSGSVITLPGIANDCVGQYVVIRYLGGETKVSTVLAQTGEDLTLAESIPPSSNMTVYVMGLPESIYTDQFTLTVSKETVLDSNSPGICVGRELGWPVLLYLENTDGDQEIEGGTVAFVNV